MRALGRYGGAVRHRASVGGAALVRRAPGVRAVAGVSPTAVLPRQMHGVVRPVMCAVRSPVLLARAAPMPGLRRGMSDATSTVTARLKEEEGVWVTLRKLGAMATRVIGLALTPVRVVMSPLWKATAPLRSAVAYVFNRFPVLKVIPFLGAFAGTMNIVFLATQKVQHSFTDFLRMISYYLTQMVVVLGGVLVTMWVVWRHRLSMRAVHRNTFRMVESLPLVRQKLGTPITLLKGKRIEMRTGGHFKLQVPSSSVVDALEKVTGRDIDNDGDVGVAGSKKPAPVMQNEVSPTASTGRFGSLWAKCMSVWARARLPTLKYKKQRAHMVFPIVGPHKEEAMVSVECVKRPGSFISTPTGYYDWKLLSVDFADNTYLIHLGDDERYSRPLITQLRKPMMDWMMSMAAIEDNEDVEDEMERLRKKQERLSSS